MNKKFINYTKEQRIKYWLNKIEYAEKRIAKLYSEIKEEEHRGSSSEQQDWNERITEQLKNHYQALRSEKF